MACHGQAGKWKGPKGSHMLLEFVRLHSQRNLSFKNSPNKIYGGSKISVLWNKVNSLLITARYKFPLKTGYTNSDMKLELWTAVWAK